MINKQYIECAYCGEHNDQENSACRNCRNQLVKDYTNKCPKCGIFISSEKQYCMLCSMLNAKSGLVGCVYGMSILLFVVGIILLFINFRIGIILSVIAIFLFLADLIIVKLRYIRIQKRYSIKRKIPL